ncbi:MAG: hypothetical protein QNJ88_05110 [Acidimicrobiia bacterium]|nr:hypothetical protein [Acidimicrobiia bacterium]
MEQGRRLRRPWLVPVGLALTFVTITVVFSNLHPSHREAKVSLVETVDGVTTARVSWEDANGNTIATRVVLPEQYASGDTVTINTAFSTPHVVTGGFEWPGLVPTAIAAATGAFLGLVVLNAMSGFGYVGNTTTVEGVREDRGFYWRS